MRELIEITAHSVNVDLRQKGVAGRAVPLYSRPLRLMPDGSLGVAYKGRLYPLGLDAKKRYLIEERSDSCDFAFGSLVDLPGIFELPYLETPMQFNPDGATFSWKIDVNHFGTFIYIDSIDDLVEDFVTALTNRYKYNIVSWGEAESQPGFRWYVQLPVGLLVEQLSHILEDYLDEASRTVLAVRERKSKDENIKLRQKLDELLKENQQLSDAHKQELEDLYLQYAVLEAELDELRAHSSHNVAVAESREQLQKLKKSDAERVVAQVLRGTYPSLAFTPDSPRVICEKFADSSMLWRVLGDLNAGVQLPLQKIHGAAGNAGWLELRKHISSGKDARGRLYCKPSKKAHQYDVVLHWKKDNKDQQNIMNTLSRYMPFDGPQCVAV